MSGTPRNLDLNGSYLNMFDPIRQLFESDVSMGSSEDPITSFWDQLHCQLRRQKTLGFSFNVKDHKYSEEHLYIPY